VPPLRFATKLAYGIGQAGEGFKNGTFETFLFFYYNQVLGMSGTLAGLAMFVALVVDAVFDPLIGSISDAHHGRLGRRHPFLYAAALPFAVAFYFLLVPPAGLSEAGLFVWLTSLAIAVRMAMAAYLVPHNALGAELSDDYHERTAIAGYRTIFGVLGGFTTTLLGFLVFLRATAEHPIGQLNPEGYPRYAAFFATAALLAVLVSAAGTHARIPYLIAPSHGVGRFTFRRLATEMRDALASPSFRALFVGVLVFFVMRGVQMELGLHVSTHFWALTTQEIALVGIVSLAGLVIGVPVWARISRTLDKKPTFLWGMIVFSIFAMGPLALKLVGLWPAEANRGAYIGLLTAAGFLAAFGGGAALIAAGSMMADLTDEHELETGRRQEGIFFGALAFSGKASSGVGHLIAGVAIDWIGFPENAVPGQVAPEVVRSLGVLYGPGIFALGMLSFVFLVRYGLTRDRVAEIQRVLAERRAGA
jgi:GPH family glycoside/pentoside/hexuronide:cation symporter